MPFTPLHLGTGLAMKSLGGRHFSFMVFGGTQVLMDIEPLLAIINDWNVLHGPTHTLAGATVIGAIAGVIGRPISEHALRLMRIVHPPFTWKASFLAAFVGSYSHIALDAIMHADMRPFWPLTAGNPWLGAISIDALHLACVAMALAGGGVLAVKALYAHSIRSKHP